MLQVTYKLQLKYNSWCFRIIFAIISSVVVFLWEFLSDISDMLVKVSLAGSVIGEALSSHPLIRKVGFTGSTPVGKTIMQRSVQFIYLFSLKILYKGH